MVLIMSSTRCSILAELDQHPVDEAWLKCEQILSQMAPFSLSARNTLHFLETARSQIIPSIHVGIDHDARQRSAQQMENPLLEQDLFHWEGSGGLDELGFLGPFDFAELQGWFGEGL